jgi:hypothetical protein
MDRVDPRARKQYATSGYCDTLELYAYHLSPIDGNLPGPTPSS